jgi:hypothetical protein
MLKRRADPTRPGRGKDRRKVVAVNPRSRSIRRGWLARRCRGVDLHPRVQAPRYVCRTISATRLIVRNVACPIFQEPQRNPAQRDVRFKQGKVDRSSTRIA